MCYDNTALVNSSPTHICVMAQWKSIDQPQKLINHVGAIFVPALKSFKKNKNMVYLFLGSHHWKTALNHLAIIYSEPHLSNHTVELLWRLFPGCCQGWEVLTVSCQVWLWWKAGDLITGMLKVTPLGVVLQESKYAPKTNGEMLD